MVHRQSAVLMSAGQMDRTLRRLAEEVLEKDGDRRDLALVGIQRRGVPLARRLASEMARRTGTAPPVGALDITLYRDDLTDIASQPIVRPTELAFDVSGRRIVLVDDVIYTGRTARAAIDELIDFGRPRRIELLVLVDRGWRELPIQPDYVGLTTETERRDVVEVRVREQDGRDEIVLTRAEET